MRNNNFRDLIREELVKRFEDVVVEEMRKHSAAVLKTNNELKYLHDLFENFKKDLELLKNQNKSDYKETQEISRKEIARIEQAFDSQRRFMKTNASHMDEVADSLQKKIDNLVDIEEFSDLKNYCSETRKDISEMSNDSMETITKILHTYSLEASKALEDHKRETSSKMEVLGNDHVVAAQLLDTYRVDARGVLKELQIYKKSVLILEKKIENLYTLIDRLQKKVT